MFAVCIAAMSHVQAADDDVLTIAYNVNLPFLGSNGWLVGSQSDHPIHL